MTQFPVVWLSHKSAKVQNTNFAES